MIASISVSSCSSLTRWDDSPACGSVVRGALVGDQRLVDPVVPHDTSAPAVAFAMGPPGGRAAAIRNPPAATACPPTAATQLLEGK